MIMFERISNYRISANFGPLMLARISHKILKKSDEMLCEMHRECARDHYQVDKARAIRGEDRMTGRSNFSRVCEKCGLARISHKILKKSDEMLCEMHRECARDHYQIDRVILFKVNFSEMWHYIAFNWSIIGVSRSTFLRTKAPQYYAVKEMTMPRKI